MSYRLYGFRRANASTITELPEYEPGRHDLGTGLYDAALVPLAGGGFYSPYSGTQAPRNERRVVAQGTLVEASAVELAARFHALTGLAGYEGYLIRLPDIETNVQQRARAFLEAVDVTREIFNQRYLRDVALAFVMRSLWQGRRYGPPFVLGEGGVFGDGAALGASGELFPLVLNPQVFTLPNAGNATATDLVITITAGTGTLSAFSLTNTTTGHVLEWNGTLAPGESLVIDVAEASALLEGVDAYDALTINKEEWMALVPGVNLMAMAFTTSTADDSDTILFDYADTYQ